MGQMEAGVKKKPKQEPFSISSELSASSDLPCDNKEQDVNSEHQFSWSCENLTDTTVVEVKKRGPDRLLQRSASTDYLFDEELNTGVDMKLSASWENLLEAATSKVNTGQLVGIFKKSPKPAPRSIATEDPLSSVKELSASWDSLAAEEALWAYSDLSASNENKGVFAGVSRRTSKTVWFMEQERDDVEAPEGGEQRCRRTIKKRRRVVSFRIKETLPKIPQLTLSSQTSDKTPVIEVDVELGELKESTAEVPLVSGPDQERDDLMEWWNTVTGWTEWNKTSNFQEDDEETAVEQAADRVYLAARLFVRLFNQRGASLQRRILELLSLSDAADQFHRKTVSAAVGGGVASVAGSVATITGLILAPFTFGASVIVTAVGISVATAGGLTSATANITDTVHSRMDRKKVEKMIQGYQEEIRDIRECLDFVQEGMDALQGWDVKQYSQSAPNKALNHSVKTVLRQGGSAGKALLINTEKLISTVQILGAAGGAVRAAQVISVTTGVMSALFLALDVFFLAKDSHELHKGAKTEFAAKIREVCKELQAGLLELNKVKAQLQKTMDGIEVEEYEEIEEETVEIEDELELDPNKLAELEKELDLLEEKLDNKAEREQKKSKEAEKGNLMSKETIREDKGNLQIKEDDELTKQGKKEGEKEKRNVGGKLEFGPEKRAAVLSVRSAKEAEKEQTQELHKETRKESNCSCDPALRWSSTNETDSKRDRYRRANALHDERREKEERAAGGGSMRRQFEKVASEEDVERGKREDGEGAKRHGEHEHSRGGYRPRANALQGDGLNT